MTCPEKLTLSIRSSSGARILEPDTVECLRTEEHHISHRGPALTSGMLVAWTTTPAGKVLTHTEPATGATNSAPVGNQPPRRGPGRPRKETTERNPS